jgi:uncharacterized membrane protein (DUF485 family)
MGEPDRRLELLNDPDFRELVRARGVISTWLTIATLVIYYGFIFVLAFKKELFGYKITENITLGIPIGIGVILASWVLTGIYVRWANTRYDALARNVKNKFDHGTSAKPGPS